ncbi:MAG: crossover junction endodeoxyribonuclease RuvC [Nitrospinota bacterium]
MRVLGIDPGCTVTGYGIIEEEKNKLKAIKWGTIKTSPKDNYPKRIKFIYDNIFEVIQDYKPDVVAVEEIFFAKNVKSAMVLGLARGAAIMAAANSKIDIAEYSALQVKQSVVGYGRADKEQVQHMVIQLLGLGKTPFQHDASDALAVAICHNNTHAFQNRIDRAIKK